MEQMTRVHLFIPCYVDQFFPNVGISTVRILRHLGCEVIYPEAQTCCGQPAFNTGYYEEACRLAVRFLDIFKAAEYVVAPSGSCITMVKNLYGELKLPGDWKRLWEEWRHRVMDITQFLTEVMRVEAWPGYFPARVTYHDACHALRELRIQDQPRKLLKDIEGLELVEMENADVCCGFGGTFSVKFADISTAMVKQKADGIAAARVDYVTSTDSSCLMNIGGYLSRLGMSTRPIHLVELLWQAHENQQRRRKAGR